MNIFRLSVLPLCMAGLLFPLPTNGQSVCLPAPRLLTTMPMGGQIGSEFDVVITGQHLDEATELRFSDPRITAERKLDEEGKPLSNTYRVKIAEDCPPGICEAAVMTRLGLSTPRAFNVSTLTEITQHEPSKTVADALPLPMNSICNAVIAAKGVNHYSFSAKRDQRIIVDCAAKGIDSKLDAVLIVADAEGQDLVVERRGGAIDYVVPEDGTYIIKVHELTFKGGPEYFYRLALTEAAPGALITRQPRTRSVSSFSWPPHGLPPNAAISEIEPNDAASQAQNITLPCDISGSFAPAADVDLFEFAAKQGEQWWIEVASERLGLPTDPTVVVQHLDRSGEGEKLVDIVQLNDIPSPVKVSTNGYAYDGPPYNAGSADVLGKIEIPTTGVFRLQISDLFGGTRNDPRNVYRLVIRKASPDFALVAWAMHMQLRNGDRNALSKPISLRGGSTMALEVVVIRRDGFDGEIELIMENLPDGVTASGIKIPKGKSRGMMLVTADEGAPRGMSSATFVGSAEIDGKVVTRTCRVASMAWPVPNHWSEIPSPRLLTDVTVSVGEELAPITIAARDKKVWQASQGEKLTIPLIHMRRSEFSGSTLAAKTIGAGFESVAFDIPLGADNSEAVLDLAALKTPPGQYQIAFYGGAVAKYQSNPQAVAKAQAMLDAAKQQVDALGAEAARLAAELKAATADEKTRVQNAIAALVEKQKAASAAVTAATKRVTAATSAAKPKDIVDIVVSQPISIHVKPAESK